MTCKLCQKVLHVKSYGIGEYPFPEHLCINKETNTITCLRCREEFKSRKVYNLHVCNKGKEERTDGTMDKLNGHIVESDRQIKGQMERRTGSQKVEDVIQ